MRREGLDRLGDGVELDLVLRPLDVLVRDVLLRRALRELRGDPEEVQSAVPFLEIKKVLEKDEFLAPVRGYRPKLQTTLI